MFRIHRWDSRRGSAALLGDCGFPKRRTFKPVAVLFTLTATHGAITWAQTVGGSIRGTIMDPSGASIAAANVTMEEENTGLKWKFSSSRRGLYSAEGLPVGRYSVTVSAPGFATAQRENVEIQEGSERLLDIRLTIGGSSQAVGVVSEDGNLDTTASAVQEVNPGEVVRDLPLNGRDWTTLASLQPGVNVVRTEKAVTLANTRGNRGLGVMMAVGGARPETSLSPGAWSLRSHCGLSL
jgi:hypothetical protein